MGKVISVTNKYKSLKRAKYAMEYYKKNIHGAKVSRRKNTVTVRLG